jgi:hypothetical protein
MQAYLEFLLYPCAKSLVDLRDRSPPIRHVLAGVP